MRRLAVLLSCCLDDEPPTVRGMAEWLNIPKPAITRAFDRLGKLGFAKRIPDPLDRRSVLIVATPSGMAYVEGLRAIMRQAAMGR